MDPIIAQIVDRCHVGERYVEVLRYVISRLSRGKRAWHAMPRRQRRVAIGMVIRKHRENRRLYAWVMGGH